MLDLLVRYRKYSILGLVVVAAVALLTAQQTRPGEGLWLAEGIAAVTAPAQMAFARVHRGAASVWVSYLDWKHLRTEVARLRAETVALRLRQLRQEALEAENLRLRTLATLRERLPERTLGAEVVARDWNGFTRGLTIDRGRAGGAERLSAVIVTSGVVGRVAVLRQLADDESKQTYIDIAAQRTVRAGNCHNRGVVKSKPVFVCQECGSQCPSGRVAAPTAARGTRLSRSARGAGDGRRPAIATRCRRPRAGRETLRRDRSSIDGGFPRASASSTACSAAASFPGRSCCSAASRASASRRCCCRPPRSSRRPSAPVLYASGEESEHQIKSRGDRLGVGDAPLFLLAETCVESILEEIGRVRPALLIVDSVQTVFSLKFQSAPGSIGQVREAATQFLFTAKGHNIPTFLVGHVTKDGNIAGPKALEHVVDTVLYFEGERHHSHRVVRAVKNRFGAISELGVFEMTGDGLKPVANPSALFLAERPQPRPARPSCARSKARGRSSSRCRRWPARTSYGMAKRMAVGIDQNRLSLLLAVLEKRAGLHLVSDDVFVNVAGGMSIDEPAADLAIVAAVASSVRNRPLVEATAVFGEVGLGGRGPRRAAGALRMREAEQMGFTRVVLPRANVDGELTRDRRRAGGRELDRRRASIGEALDACLAALDLRPAVLLFN